jgi:hypothetical protein
VDIAKVETDVGLWSELNKLMTSYQTARKMSTLHKERAANSMALNRRWYWRRQLRSVANTIALFPATEDDLRPRVEWLRSLLFSFVAFVKLTEGDHRCRVLIHRLFCRSLAEHQQRLRILTELQARAQQYHTADEKNMCDPGETASPKQGKGIVESPEESAAQRTSSNNMREAVEKVLEEYERLIGSRRRWGDDPDARALREEAVHPMNAAADGKRLMRSSTAAGTHYNLEETGNFETFVRPRHAQRAPEIILRAVEAVTGNSYKEVQLVLQHDPSVAPVLREAKLDVEQTIEREVKVEETHKLRMLQQRQQFRQSETMKVRLMAGPLHAVGEGRGDHLHEAIHNAGLDMLHFYYSRKQPAGPAAPASTAASGPASGVQDSAPTTANAQHGSSVGLDSDGSTKDTQPSDSSDYFF